MARYSPDSKERVREATDMLDLVSAHTELRRAGPTRYQGLCPFHEERTPSFGVEPFKKVYHCFGCGASGDAFTFVMSTQGVDFPGALELLADRYGVQLEREEEDPQAAARRERRERLLALLERTAGYYARYLWESPEATHARRHLSERGLEEDVVRAFRVGYAPSAWDHMLTRWRRAGFRDDELRDAGVAQRSARSGALYDRFRARLIFPLCDARGRVRGFGARRLRGDHPAKYVNSPESDLYQKRRLLFGADRARVEAARAGETIVVEGYTDVLAMHQAGMANTVGLMGTALAEDQLPELARLAPRVSLALDADASGQEAMVRAARVAAERSLELRVIALPAASDPAELVASEGAEAMRSRVGASVPFARFRAERILEQGDLSRSDGRDRAVAELRDLLGSLPPSSLREELVRLAAGRLGLSEQLVASLAAAPPSGGGDGAAGGRRRRGPLDRREETERTFLALCIALPREGRQALSDVDVERHFTGQLVRRAAAHLRDHLADPLAGVAPEDGDLSALLAELSLRATRQPSDPGTLRVQAVQLEAARLDREIAAARADGSLDVSDLAAERLAVKARLDDAMDSAMER